MSSIKPVYLLAGGRSKGGKKNASLFQAVFEASGLASPAVAYVGAASDDDAWFFRFISREIRAGGAGKVIHAPIAPTKADLNKTKAILENADIIFMSGGDVERGMEVLREKRLTDFLMELYRQGKPFFGASAGSIMLAREWVRWRDPDDDASAEIFKCTGIAPVLCDTHAEDDDWVELKALLALEPDRTTGYGIPTGGGISVLPDGRVEALGLPIARYTHRGGKVEQAEDLLPA